MKFELIIEDLLTELSGNEIYKRYYNYIPYETFKTIIQFDPKTHITDREIVKVGPYSKLLLKMFKTGGLLPEDAEKAREYLTYVYRSSNIQQSYLHGAKKVKILKSYYISERLPLYKRWYDKTRNTISRTRIKSKRV